MGVQNEQGKIHNKNDAKRVISEETEKRILEEYNVSDMSELIREFGDLNEGLLNLNK